MLKCAAGACDAQIGVNERHRARRKLVCVEGKIRQVLNNLLGNAIDALPPRGGAFSFEVETLRTGRMGERASL
jgi:signal transduction histidine kinase